MLDFDELCDLFIRLQATTPPAELHGLLTGQLCAGQQMTRDVWLRVAKDFMDAQAIPDAQDADLLMSVYYTTITQLVDDDWGFYPLLPDDTSELMVRIQALGEWCQGFLVGFALVDQKQVDQKQADQKSADKKSADKKSNQGQKTPYSDLVSDALSDLAAIAQVGEPEDDTDESENDFMHLVEYVKLAALNIFVECGPKLEPAKEQAAADEFTQAEEAEPAQEDLGAIANLFAPKQRH